VKAALSEEFLVLEVGMIELLYFTKCAIALFAIVNPLGILPIILSLIGDQPIDEQKRSINRAMWTVFFTLMATAITGQLIFSLFDVTLGALRIAGGIFLFILAIPMLYGEQSKAKINPKERAHAIDKEDPAITPIGIPLIAGPGAISTVMSLMEQSKTLPEKGIVLAAIIVVIATAYAILRFGTPVAKLFGRAGLRVMTRIMGLILAVIAVQFVINGIGDALPQILGR
jgi:MarC family membrane protein